VIGTTDAQAVNQVDQDRIGMATGLLNTVRAGGGTLATTLFGTAVANTLQPWLGESGRAARITAGNLAGPDRMLEAEVFTGAWKITLWCVAGICAVAALTVWALLAPSRPRHAATASPPRRRPFALSGTAGSANRCHESCHQP
jgi:hypothetical protein